MIDFVRFQFRGEEKDRFENSIKNKPEDFFKKYGDSNQILSSNTGEIKDYPIWLNIENFKIKISSKTATIEGSLHKFYNVSFQKENHNYNDFSYSQIIEAMDILNKHVDNLSAGILTCLEFGFNIEPRINVKDLIVNRIHRFNDCNNINESFTFSKLYREFSYTNYDFKVYEKGRQFRSYFSTMPNILRVELRLRGKELRNIGIYHSSDLLLKQNLRKLFLHFQSKFKELVIIDPIPADIPERDKNLIYDYKHLDFWTKRLGPNYHSHAKYRLKKEVENLIEDYGLNSTKKEIADLLKKKYIYLINN